MLVSAALFCFAGLLLAAVAVPLAGRRVPPGPWYGLRTRATFADERVWYDANAKSGRDLLAFGVGYAVLAAGLALVPGISEPLYSAVLAGVLVAGALALAVVGIRRADRMLRDRRSGGSDARE